MQSQVAFTGTGDWQKITSAPVAFSVNNSALSSPGPNTASTPRMRCYVLNNATVAYTAHVDAMMISEGTPEFFDGSQPHVAWQGAAHNSPSVLTGAWSRWK